MATVAQLGATVSLDNENGLLHYFSEFKNGTGSYFMTRFVNGTFELSFSINGSKTVIRYMFVLKYCCHYNHLFHRGMNKLPLGQLMRTVIRISEDKVSIRITSMDILTVLESINEPISITVSSVIVTLHVSYCALQIVTVGTFYAGGLPPMHILPVITSNLIGCMEKPVRW